LTGICQCPKPARTSHTTQPPLVPATCSKSTHHHLRRSRRLLQTAADVHCVKGDTQGHGGRAWPRGLMPVVTGAGCGPRDKLRLSRVSKLTLGAMPLGSASGSRRSSVRTWRNLPVDPSVTRRFSSGPARIWEKWLAQSPLNSLWACHPSPLRSGRHAPATVAGMASIKTFAAHSNLGKWWRVNGHCGYAI